MLFILQYKIRINIMSEIKFEMPGTEHFRSERERKKYKFETKKFPPVWWK